MTAPYINHLTLSTSNSRRSPRAEVGDDTLMWLAPWLRETVALGTPQPLPVAALARYSLLAQVEDGALLATRPDLRRDDPHGAWSRRTEKWGGLLDQLAQLVHPSGEGDEGAPLVAGDHTGRAEGAG